MNFRTLTYEKLGAVVRVTANRPEVLNAQSRVMILELDEAFRSASEDVDTRVIIVAGAGQHFSAGHDLGSPEELEDQKAHPVGPGIAENLKRLSELYLETCLRWRDVPKPTIAQVQGYCIMGGLMLASCCDLIIAAEDALFADRAVRWGGSHVQYFTMPWDLGPRKAKEYLFTGDYVDAPTALELGLVNRVVKREAAGRGDAGAGPADRAAGSLRAQAGQGVGERDHGHPGPSAGRGSGVQELHADHSAPPGPGHLWRGGAGQGREGSHCHTGPEVRRRRRAFAASELNGGHDHGFTRRQGGVGDGRGPAARDRPGHRAGPGGAGRGRGRHGDGPRSRPPIRTTRRRRAGATWRARPSRSARMAGAR